MVNEIQETFGTYVTRVERAIAVHPKLYNSGELIFGSDVAVPLLRDGDDDSITKVTIAYPLYNKNMFYIVSVPADKHIEKHQHDEDIFRILLSGDLIINGRPVNLGEWFVVPENTPYEIKTVSGYVSLSAYTSNCRTNRSASGKHLVED